MPIVPRRRPLRRPLQLRPGPQPRGDGRLSWCLRRRDCRRQRHCIGRRPLSCRKPAPRLARRLLRRRPLMTRPTGRTVRACRPIGSPRDESSRATSSRLGCRRRTPSMPPHSSRTRRGRRRCAARRGRSSSFERTCSSRSRGPPSRTLAHTWPQLPLDDVAHSRRPRPRCRYALRGLRRWINFT